MDTRKAKEWRGSIINHRHGRVIFVIRLPLDLKNKKKAKYLKEVIAESYEYLCSIEGKRFSENEIEIAMQSGWNNNDFKNNEITIFGEIIIQDREKHQISNLMQKINERGNKGSI